MSFAGGGEERSCPRRGAPRGSGAGRGFPSPRKTMAGIAERSPPSPRGKSAPDGENRSDAVGVSSWKPCGVLFPRAVRFAL